MTFFLFGCTYASQKKKSKECENILKKKEEKL